MKLLVIGHGRHGKDTVCEILRDFYGYNFISSSEFCSELFIFDNLKNKYNYQTSDQCYQDRHNHRAEWYDLISAYNDQNPARLGTEIFKTYDIYCGLRNQKEFWAMKENNVFDYAIWVDRSKILPYENSNSMTLKPAMADIIIDNNNTILELHRKVDQLMCFLEDR